MKKLLIVTTIPSTFHAFLLPFARHFRAQGWRVDAMASGISSCTECLQYFDRVWDVEWSRDPLDPRNLILAPRLIQEVIQKEQYDIVHVHTPVASFVTRYAIRTWEKQPKPQVIYTAHGFHFHSGGKIFRNSVFLALEKLAGSWTDHLVVINRDDEEAAKHYKLIPPKRVHYMPGIGVDLQYYSPDAVSEAEVEQVRHELGLAPGTAMLLSVAEFIQRKRPQDILKAFARLARPTVCLAFAGVGPLMEQMQHLVSQLGIENQVRFLGRRHVPPLMRLALGTVLASEQEGLPRCVMESMALETPVIGTNIRGTRELLTEGCGLLVQVGDVQGLTNAIAYLLDHPQEARMMGKRGREVVAAYDLRDVIKLHEDLYAEALLAKSSTSKVDLGTSDFYMESSP